MKDANLGSNSDRSVFTMGFHYKLIRAGEMVF